MIASAHIAAGAVAGLAAARVSRGRVVGMATAFVLGVLSHVLLDAIPHSDYEPLAASLVMWIALGEVAAVGTAVGFILHARGAQRWSPYVALGAIGGAVPDAKFVASLWDTSWLSELIWRYGDWFHTWFHAPPPVSLSLALSVEIGCTILSFAMLAVFSVPTHREDERRVMLVQEPSPPG